MTSTVSTQPALSGYTSFRPGMSMPNQRPAAVAFTVTIAPARKQNITPFARLYAVTSLRPQIFSSWKYSVSRARTAMGAVRNIQLSTASRLPAKRPPTTAGALTPEAMNSGPIMSSVPAVCSPAYWPTKLENPSRARSGTGSRSYSSTGSSCRVVVSSAMHASYRASARPARHEADRAEESRRHGVHLVHVLRLETGAVPEVEQLVVGSARPAMWLMARLPTSMRKRFTPGRSCAVTSTTYGGHQADPARRPFTYTTAASRTGADTHAWKRARGPPASTGTAAPRSIRTGCAGRRSAAGTSTSFSYTAVPE